VIPNQYKAEHLHVVLGEDELECKNISVSEIELTYDLRFVRIQYSDGAIVVVDR
jgi:hypothetical protein